MKICLSCSNEIPINSWKCIQCGWEPTLSKGIFHFAPDLSTANESYDSDWYEELASLDATNFWCVARNRLIRWLTHKFTPQSARYLEVGCGTGFVLQMLCKSFPEWSVFATEMLSKGIQFAVKRVPDDVTFFQMDVCSIPFRNEFNVIGAFDVLEHTRDDITAMEQIHAALKPGGYFMLSVPQHMFLWSKYDELVCHFRRYSSDEIEGKLKSVGFNIVASTSFNSLLLPLMMLSRYLNKKKSISQVDFLDEVRISPITNFLLSAVLALEFQLIRLGLSLPIGGSRIIVARKQNF